MPQETPFGVTEYLMSLRLDTDGPTEVAYLEGAHLYRVSDDHFLVVACSQHKHRGHELLRRVIPPHWICFHEAVNSDDQFTAHHYGPDLDAPAVED